MSIVGLPATRPTKERAVAQLLALLKQAGGEPTDEGLVKVFRSH